MYCTMYNKPIFFPGFLGEILDCFKFQNILLNTTYKLKYKTYMSGNP